MQLQARGVGLSDSSFLVGVGLQRALVLGRSGKEGRGNTGLTTLRDAVHRSLHSKKHVSLFALTKQQGYSVIGHLINLRVAICVSSCFSVPDTTQDVEAVFYNLPLPPLPHSF